MIPKYFQKGADAPHCVQEEASGRIQGSHGRLKKPRGGYTPQARRVSMFNYAHSCLTSNDREDSTQQAKYLTEGIEMSILGHPIEIHSLPSFTLEPD